MVDKFNLALAITCNPYNDIINSELCYDLFNDVEINSELEFSKAYAELCHGNSSESVFNKYFDGCATFYGQTEETLTNELNNVTIQMKTERLQDVARDCLDVGDFNGYLEAQQAIVNIIESFKKLDVFSMKDYTANSHTDDIIARANDDKYILSTGFKELDNAIGGGFQRKSEVMGILAQSNAGKSWILHAICNNLNRDGEKVGIYSPEMPAESVVDRIATLQGHISNVSVTKGKGVDIDMLRDIDSKLSKRISDIEITEAKHFGGVDPTVSQLKEWCIKSQLTVLAIDGISYIRGIGKADWQRQSNVAQELMNLSTELNIPVIYVVQASRIKKGEDFDGNSSTAGSADIYRKSTISFKITTAPCDDLFTSLKINVDKNRYGGGKNLDINYRWKIDTGDFEACEDTDNTQDTEQVSIPTQRKPRPQGSDVF